MKNQVTIIGLRYDPLIIYRRQNHITFIFIKKQCHMTSLIVQMAHKDSRLKALFKKL